MRAPRYSHFQERPHYLYLYNTKSIQMSLKNFQVYHNKTNTKAENVKLSRTRSLTHFVECKYFFSKHPHPPLCTNYGCLTLAAIYKEARPICSSLRHWNHKHSCRHTYRSPLKGESKAVDWTQLQGPVTRPWQHGNKHTSFLEAGNFLNTSVTISLKCLSSKGIINL
jgi:hypothetical protein